MRAAEVIKRETDLISLYTEAKEASKLFTEACQLAATHAGTTTKVVKAYIVALASEKANVVAQEAAQLSMLFEALPTVAGVSPDDQTTVTVLPRAQVAA